MAGLTLAHAEAQLAAYLEAESRVLRGQSYTIAGRTWTRADLGDIQAGIALWDGRCRQLEASSVRRGRAVTVVPTQ